MLATEERTDTQIELKPGEHAIVRCNGFRCLAYQDREGKWWDVAQRTQLPKVLEVIQRFPA